MERKKVYLSSPERLKRDAKKLFEEKKALCANYGFELMEYPEEIYINKDSYENNRKLAEKRLQMIKDCDIFIADTNDFRAYVEPFGETALEMGIAFGFDKKMYGYMKDTRVCSLRYSGKKEYDEENKSWKDANGIGFEPGPVNLMLEYSATIIQGDLEDVLKMAKEEEDVH